MTPRPSPVPTGAPRPWEGSVKGGGGSSRTEPSVFLSRVGGSDPVSASGSPVLPLRRPPGQHQRRAQSPNSHGACMASRRRRAGVMLTNLCRTNVPASGHPAGQLLAKEGPCCRAEPVRQRLWGTHACGRAHGPVPMAEPTRGRGTRSTHAPLGAHSHAGCKQRVGFAFFLHARCMEMFVF